VVTGNAVTPWVCSYFPATSAALTLSVSHGRTKQLRKNGVVVLYVLALVAVVVSVDILFFRDHFWERLIVNVGIVLAFAAFFLKFLRRA
jgi:hypothetical protein